MVIVNKPSAAYYLPATLVAIVSLCVAGLGDNANIAIRYDRDAILENAWWRLLTGNLAHLSWNHLWMNLAGLLMICILYDRQLTAAKWSINFVICSLGVGICLLLFNPDLHWYVGLSGTLHGLLMTGILINIIQGQRLDLILFIALIGKLAWEQFAGPLPGSAETAGGAVIVDAHLYGAISGLIMGVIFASLVGKSSNNSNS